MKAIIYNEYGPPAVLHSREIEKPVSRDNEVLVKVYATSVSSGDCRLRRADPFAVRLYNGLTRPQRITVLGNELSGEVEQIGQDVSQFKVGELVFGQANNLGANAEYLCLTEEEIADKPTNLT